MGAVGSLQLPDLASESSEASEGYEFSLPAVVLVGGASMAAGEMLTALELRVGGCCTKLARLREPPCKYYWVDEAVYTHSQVLFVGRPGITSQVSYGSGPWLLPQAPCQQDPLLFADLESGLEPEVG